MSKKEKSKAEYIKSLRFLPVSDLYVTDSQRISKRLFNREEFYAFDTETFDGCCKLITDSKDNFILDPSFQDAINFLWQYSSKNYYRAFYNLDFDISAILKLSDFDEQTLHDLIHGKKIEFGKYTLFYIRPRMFQISTGSKTIYFVDLFNMYQRSLNLASKEFLGANKIDIIDPEKLNTDLEYWDDNLLDIIKYCKRDSELTAKLGNFIMQKTKASGLLMPKFFTSYASLSKQYFRFNCRIPQIKYIPTNILDIGFQCYFGGRFETLKRGFFELLHCYDVNSAYPNVIRELPSFKYGKWEKVSEISKKECIGYYKVILDIKEKHISPYILRDKHLVVFPNGFFITWITWYEADLLRDSIEKIYYGYEYIPNSREYYPFKKAIDFVYKQKTKYKNKNFTFYWLFKNTMNALYGCFIERYKKYEDIITTGMLFNSVYGSIITAKTRWKLLKDIRKKDYKHIVAFHTDSIISEKTLNLKCSTEIGDWNLEKQEQGIVLMSGVYQIGKEAKRRGFSGSKLDWFELLKKNKDKDYVKVPYTKVMKIAECLRRFHSLEQVNRFIKSKKKMYINADRKRIWDRNFDNCEDVLNNNIKSVPLELYGIDSKHNDLV